MIAKTHACILVGIRPVLVEVQGALGKGFSGLQILGLPPEIARQMRERIRSALEACHLTLPARRMVLNFRTPVDWRWARSPLSELDLSAFWLLVNLMQRALPEKKKSHPSPQDLGPGIPGIPLPKPSPHPLAPGPYPQGEQSIFVGNLELDGTLCPLCYPTLPQQIKNKFIDIYKENLIIYSPKITGFLGDHRHIVQMESVKEWVKNTQHKSIFENKNQFKKDAEKPQEKKNEDQKNEGQDRVHHAPTQGCASLAAACSLLSSLEQNPILFLCGVVAAAGRHHILLCGEPGIGKTHLLSKIHVLMPELSEEQAWERTLLTPAYERACESDYPGLVQNRGAPLVTVHHTSTMASLVGGADLEPAACVKAHGGVLFLDELAEFSRPAVEALREPLEEGLIRLAKAKGAVVYPAQFTLAAAANPCGCGYLLSYRKSCHCSLSEARKYIKNLSGPLLDRFCIKVWIPPAGQHLTQDDHRTLEHWGKIFMGHFKKNPTQWVNQFKAIQHKIKNTTIPADFNPIRTPEQSEVLSARGLQKIRSLCWTLKHLHPDMELSQSLRVAQSLRTLDEHLFRGGH